jgi:hypothetical protein
MIRGLERFFLPAWPAERLGLLRIAIGLYVLQDLVRVRDGVIAVGRTDPAMWDPIGVCTWLSGPLDPSAWAWIYDATLVGAVLFTLGIGWRVIGPLFASLLLFTWTYRLSWQMLYHVHHLTMLHVLVLGAAPGAAAACSVDAWIAGRRGKPTDAVSWAYGWPVRLISIVTVITYLLAGIAKVDKAGLAWANGDNLLQQIAYDGVYKAVLAHPKDEPYPIIAFAFQHPWIMLPLAVLALTLELGSPLALVHPKVGYAWSALTLGMHWGIHAFMNLVFPYHVFGIAFLSFFPLERLIPARFRGQIPASSNSSSSPPDASVVATTSSS